MRTLIKVGDLISYKWHEDLDVPVTGIIAEIVDDKSHPSFLIKILGNDGNIHSYNILYVSELEVIAGCI